MKGLRPNSAGARGLLIALAALALLGAAAIAFVGDDDSPPALPARASRPPLMLLTTLPIVFGERFSIEGGGSPALEALERRYRVVPISVTNAAELKQARMLLMAHPLAQTAESLVELDLWVREGGRLLLLADPTLDWESERPLGDLLRPPPAFADTGLLGHWGLRLDAPEERGPAQRELGGYRVATSSPGQLVGGCSIGEDGFVAHCRVGEGTATIVADADFLNVEALNGSKEHNLNALLAELARLEQH